MRIGKTRFPKNLPERQEIIRFNKGNIKGNKYISNFLKKPKILSPLKPA